MRKIFPFLIFLSCFFFSQAQSWPQASWNGKTYFILPDSIEFCAILNQCPGLYDDHELPDGNWIQWMNGETHPLVTGTILNNLPVGDWLRYAYHSNPSVGRTGYFILERWPMENGQVNGIYKRFQNDGNIFRTIHYLNGVPEGASYSTFSNGDTMQIEYYINGEMAYRVYWGNGEDTTEVVYFMDSTRIAGSKYAAYIPDDSTFLALKERMESRYETGIYLRYKYGIPHERKIYYRGLLIYVEKLDGHNGIKAEGPCYGTNHAFMGRTRGFNPNDPPLYNYHGTWTYYKKDGTKREKEFWMGLEQEQ